MDKRGGMNKMGSHADWAISMGIFLVYFLVLFIIIRPGIEPVHDQDILLDIVEEGLSKDVKWVVKMTPLFVRTCNAGSREISIIVEDKKNAWSFTNAIADKVPIGGGEFRTEFNGDFRLTCGGGFPHVKDTKFDLYYIPQKKDVDPELYVRCTGQASESQCKAELGSSEDLEGINWRELNDLEKRNYESIKDDWGFPESKEFSISIDDNNITGRMPYENINVFVREWKDLEVDDHGRRKEIMVNIKVW